MMRSPKIIIFTLKFPINILVSFIIIAELFFNSCTNNLAQGIAKPEIVAGIGTPQVQYKQVVKQPLKFSKAKKIDFDGLKKNSIKPRVEKFYLDKIPSKPYDSADFKPFSKPVTETKFDYNTLPERDFDLDQLPSKPLKFKTYLLPPPKLIKAGLPHLKNAALSLYEFGEAQGLQGKIVSGLLTDHYGFLWIATIQGLYRYDGENLLLYIPGPLDHAILYMAEDSRGRIWMTTEHEGVQVFDPRTGVVRKTNIHLGLVGTDLLSLMLDKQQRLWIAGTAPAGVNILDTKTEDCKWLDKKHGLSDSVYANGVVTDKQQQIWIATRKGLTIIDPKRKKIKYLDRAHGLGSDTTGRLFCDQANRIWAEMPDGVLNVVDAGKNSIQTIREAEFPKKVLFTFSQDSEGKIWIGTTTTGVKVIDIDKRMAKNISTTDGLDDKFAIAISHNKNGQAWIATVGGMNMIEPDRTIKLCIGNTAVTTQAEDDSGLIWVGSAGTGIDIIDRATKTLKKFTTKQVLTNDSLQLIKTANGKIYIGSNGGLDVIDEAAHTIAHFTRQQGLADRQVTCTIADERGFLWIGGSKGIDIYNPNDNTLRHIGKEQGLQENIAVDCMLEDRRGRIWVSLFSGKIAVIDKKAGTIQYLNYMNGREKNGPTVLTLDKEGNVWIGTNKGISIARHADNTLTAFSTEQGLISNSVISMNEYQGRMYVGTNSGISVITPEYSTKSNKKQWEVASWGKPYGINKINVGFFLTDIVTKDGLFWWGDNGVTVMDLSKKDTSQNIPYVSGMEVMDRHLHFINHPKSTLQATDTLWNLDDTEFNKSAAWHGSAKYTRRINLKWDSVDGPGLMPVNLQLPYDQNFIQFHLGAINLNRRDSSWYSYYLIGADETWSDDTSEPVTRNYFNLKWGTYTFKVVAKNANGTWSKPAQFTFTINPPWWQTWWAYVLYVCLLTGVVYGFVYYRSLQLLKEKRLLEHKVHLRTEEVLQQKEEIEAQRDELEKAFGDLKVTQTQLIQSEKLASLGELTAGIAHEIQNPLNFVNNFAEVSIELIAELRDEQLREPREPETEEEILNSLEQNLQKINQHGKRADGIVKNMLQHSRNNSGERQVTDINALADEYFRLSYHGLRAKDKTFNSAMETHLDGSLPPINIIPQDLGRVLLNLFNNAFYAVHQKKKTAGPTYKPTVTLTTGILTPPPGSGSRGIMISVLDNGNGIPDAIKDKIMQPFFTTKPAGEGTGLGLSLSYDIVVKGHRGSISIDTREGEFTEFKISIPY